MSLLNRRNLMAMIMEDEEVKEWKTLQEATPIGEDMRTIHIAIPDAQDVMIVFYGRANNADDSLSNANDVNSIHINNKRLSNSSLTYIRPVGICFYTVLRVFSQNGYIDGYANPKGNYTLHAFSDLGTGEKITNISLVSNNLFKAESTLAVYYR